MVLGGPAMLVAEVNGRGYLSSGGPRGNRSKHPRVAPHNTYRCSGDQDVRPGSGRWVTIACFSEEEWQALVEVMGSPEWAADPRFCTNTARIANEDALDACIESWTRERDPYDVMFALQAAVVPAGVVQTARDKLEHDPQLRARGFYPKVEHPEIGLHAMEGMPVTALRTPWQLRTAAPLFGGDVQAVYGDLVGLSDERLGDLIAGAAV
jgi:crotonobetainyl-CoA:carnitine CoA-transferase CaiB-like acyl-CoA transferase